MIVEIENAIIARLKNAGLNVGDLDVKEGIKRVGLPAVFISTEAGEFTKETMSKYRLKATILVAVAFKHLKSDTEQRHGVYPIIESVISLLMLQTLDLDIRPLKPVRFRNVTDTELADNGLIVIQMEFETSFIFTLIPGDETFDMLRIAMQYYLQDPEDDDIADAEDIVTLTE